jgi:hypothetical protein
VPVIKGLKKHQKDKGHDESHKSPEEIEAERKKHEQEERKRLEEERIS